MSREDQNTDRHTHAALVYKRLREHYGAKPWHPRYDPLDELVLTILSQNTSDTNRDVAFEALKEHYTTWDAIAAAPLEELQGVIRPAGLITQSRRLGLIDDGTSRARAHNELAHVAPEDSFFEFHINLIEHGRAVCQARRPRCERCFLTDVCTYYQTSNMRESVDSNK